MGWAEPRGTGRWRAAYRADGEQLYVKDEDGNTVLYTSEAKARRAANAKENEERTRATRRKTRRATGTFGEWVDEVAAEEPLHPKTESVLRVHIRPQWGDVPLVEIDNREDVREWVNALRATRVVKHTANGYVQCERKLAAGTVQRIFYTFSRFMTLAVERDRIPFTPCQHIGLPELELPDERFLTVAEFEKLHAAAPDDHMELFADLGVGTGMRFGEMAGLHRHRINTDHKSILIRDAWSDATGQMKPPKGRKRRGVPITDELNEKLKTYMAAHPGAPCRELHVDSNGNVVECRGSLLFSRRDGHAWTHTHTQRLWWEMVKTAGIGPVRIHDLRHTYASWLIQRGRRKDEVRDLLGHTSVIITERYAFLNDTHWAAVREALSNSPQQPVPPTPGTDPATTAGAGQEAPQTVSAESAPQVLPGAADDGSAKIIQFPLSRRSAS